MAERKNPFKRHCFPRAIIPLAARWYCGYRLSCRDVRDLSADRGEGSIREMRDWRCKRDCLCGRSSFQNPHDDAIVLVPVPRSTPLPDEALWPARIACDVLHEHGLDQDVQTCLRRTGAVSRSSNPPEAERPLVRRASRRRRHSSFPNGMMLNPAARGMFFGKAGFFPARHVLSRHHDVPGLFLCVLSD